MSVCEMKVFLQAAETGTGDVGAIEDVEDEDSEEGGDETEINLANDWVVLECKY